MRSVGIRELRDRATAILRRVREKGEAVDVTLRGQVVARLVPAGHNRLGEGAEDQRWEEIDDLAAEIGARWAGQAGAADAVAEQRR